jgi:hypothetical protein
MPNKTMFHFCPMVKGLYTYNMKHGEDPQEWVLITTVKKKMELYTKHEYEAAVHAHWVQNIIMHPRVQVYGHCQQEHCPEHVNYS